MLIVDDNATNRQLLSKLLQPLGFELREAANGQEAFELWKTWRPHLIWMDIRMPVTNGYDATQKIREREEQRSTRTIILALTAISLEDEETTAISIGCDGFLRKPFRGTDVFDLIHKHLGVRFVYEEKNQSTSFQPVSGQASIRQSTIRKALTPETLAMLPADLRNNLYEVIEPIDVDRAVSLIDRIRQHNALLTEAVTELVDNYRFDLLQEWVEPIKTNR